MKIKKLMLWEILIPQADNDGSQWSVAWHQQWDAKVSKLAGGISIFHSIKGIWLNPKSVRRFDDYMIPVRIACDRKTMDEIVDITMSHYAQDAVMAYVISTEVVIKNKKG